MPQNNEPTSDSAERAVQRTDNAPAASYEVGPQCFELVEVVGETENPLVAAPTLEQLGAETRRLMGRYRLYHGTVLIGTYRDAPDAVEEMYRYGDSPRPDEWFIIQGDECVAGDPRRFGRSPRADHRQGDDSTDENRGGDAR